MRRQLAQDDGAGGAQADNRLCVAVWHVIDEQMRVAGRPHARGFVDVFDAYRNAMQRAAAMTARDLAVGLARGGAGLVGGQGDEGVQSRIELFNARETSFGDVDGLEFATREKGARLGNGERG